MKNNKLVKLGAGVLAGFALLAMLLLLAALVLVITKGIIFLWHWKV